MPGDFAICFSFADGVGDQLRFNAFTLARTLPDDSWKQLASVLAECDEVNLSYLTVPGDVLLELSRSTRLRRLDLGQSVIEEMSLAAFSETQNLETVNLFKTGVSIDWIQASDGYPKMRRLFLGGNQLSSETIAEAQRRLPDCVVVGDLALLPNESVAAAPESKPYENPNPDEQKDI